MSKLKQNVGHAARLQKGYWQANKYLILRRISQVAILLVFLIGPWFGWWIVKGNLTSSLVLNTIPLTDPYVFLQSLAAGFLPYKTAIIGALIVTAFYLLVGGRTYCSWVCPLNIITDIANWLRYKFKIKKNIININKNARYWLLGISLITALIVGKIIWELVNPVSILHRSIIFGMEITWTLALSIFLFELLISKRGWCGGLCPVGAFYGLLGKFSLLRISAHAREKCNNCMECYVICPEPQVINPALRSDDSPIISNSNCTNCGRCIDICAEDVFKYSTILPTTIAKSL